MVATLREALRQILPPEAYQYVRMLWWQISFYMPRKAASIIVQRNPNVEGFGDTQGLESLVKAIRDVNVFAPTKMCRVMTKHGSDKGKYVHNYTTIYAALFQKLCQERVLIFELGLGTNNPELVSSMGIYGRPGASLRGWRELFPLAEVRGADIDRKILFEEEHIKTFYCDQLDKKAIQSLWLDDGLKNGADLIIDDGLHTFEANTAFLDGSLEYLRPGGVYVIEDVCAETMAGWRDQLATNYSRRFPQYEFTLVAIPSSTNERDNNLVIIQRRVEADAPCTS